MAAKSRRGAIGESWWSERFLAVLEKLGVGGRLTRGRTYARAGQVIDLGIEPGEIVATVQGSRAEPYRARIGLTPFAEPAWEAVEDAFARDSWYAASLLGGSVPDDLEDVFTSVGLSLFPTGAREMPMDCSCPDWSVPCKHLAAVAYLVAERFDEDPFLILRWRGRDRTSLLAGDPGASRRRGTGGRAARPGRRPVLRRGRAAARGGRDDGPGSLGGAARRDAAPRRARGRWGPR